jgi:hypothetical protein
MYPLFCRDKPHGVNGSNGAVLPLSVINRSQTGDKISILSMLM